MWSGWLSLGWFLSVCGVIGEVSPVCAFSLASYLRSHVNGCSLESAHGLIDMLWLIPRREDVLSKDRVCTRGGVAVFLR